MTGWGESRRSLLERKGFGFGLGWFRIWSAIERLAA